MAQIGIITEQNDLGLGFDVIKESDQKTAQEACNKDKKLFILILMKNLIRMMILKRSN